MHARSLRILAAEDAASVRDLLELYMAKAGHRLDLVGDGAEALERFKAQAYDLVILDVQMPVMDGRAAAGAMRAFESETGRPAAVLLALTGTADKADLERCLAAGCDGALPKPFTRDALFDAVSRLTGAPAPAAPTDIKADPEFADLIPKFLDSCRFEAAEMRRALARQDYPALAGVGHRLVGSGASYGFAGVSAAARRIEHAARLSDAPAVQEAIEELADYLSKVKVRYE